MKRNAIARIVIYCVIIAALTGILITGMDFSNFRFQLGGSGGNYSSGSGQVDMAEIDRIEIEWVSGEVNVSIKPEGGSTIDFAEEGATEGCTMVYEVRGRTLILKYEKPAVHIGIFQTPDKALTVTVPADWGCKGLEIETVSAKVDVLLLNVTELDVSSVSGSVKLYCTNAWDMDVETVSGACAVLCDSANKINCSTVSGEFEVHICEAAKEIDFESVSGDLKVAIFKELGFEAQLDSASGKMYSDFSTNYESGRYNYGDRSLKIDAESVSGDLHIREVQLALTEQ